MDVKKHTTSYGMKTQLQKVEDKNQPIDESKSSTQTEGSSVGGLGSTTEQFKTTMESQRALAMALRTVPVKLRNGHREITVNALLDDGSKESYINSDVAAELVLNQFYVLSTHTVCFGKKQVQVR